MLIIAISNPVRYIVAVYINILKIRVFCNENHTLTPLFWPWSNDLSDVFTESLMISGTSASLGSSWVLLTSRNWKKLCRHSSWQTVPMAFQFLLFCCICGGPFWLKT